MSARKYRSIVVLTGAGISAESGIDTFRGVGGLWENHRIEEVASPHGFARDPQLVHKFYNARRSKLLGGDIQPNAAHHALVVLERQFNGEFLLVTQNIDHLHELAGSRHLIHMHGELLKSRCGYCSSIFSVENDLGIDSACSSCERSGGMRPHVVWFGEMPMEMERIYGALGNCDLFISIGTSGHVYPAAGFVEIARSSGSHTVEINLEHSEVTNQFHESLYGHATQIVPQFVEQLLQI